MRYRRLVKRPGLMRKKASSRSRNKDISESHNSPIDHIMFLQRTIGNQAVQRILQGPGVRGQVSGVRIQPKLRIGQPNDVYEQEADKMSETVMKMPESTVGSGRLSGDRREYGHIQRMCAECEEDLQRKTQNSELGDLELGSSSQEELHRQPKEEEEENTIQTKEGSIPSNKASSNLEAKISSLQGSGKPLSKPTRAFFEPRFGQDFSDVNVHADERAAETAKSVNARAFTTGKDIIFGKGQYAPEKLEGKRLLGHELTHVVQQASLRSKTVQRRVRPEDISGEMIGQAFVVEGPFTSGVIHLNGGETVYIILWNDTADTVRVRLPAPHIHGMTPFDIPKTLLRPASSSDRGIAPYSAGVSQQVRNIERGEKRITEERSRRGGPRPGEIARLEALQQKRQRLLNRRLIQETMFNRFDGNIKRWTDYYNNQFRYTGSNALDPDMVKSMLFQESQMGTAGEHLEMFPAWEVRSRFNIGQVIDSAAAALLLMMREIQPTLIASYHLQTIDRDRVQAQRDLQHLLTARNLTSTDRARLTELQAIQTQGNDWGLSFAETFMWLYRARGETIGFEEAVEELFSNVRTGQPRRSLDYDFWIRTAIRWLFEKRRSVSSWQEAIRAYNGSGARARHYSEAIRSRASEATTAQGSGSSYKPSRI